MNTNSIAIIELRLKSIDPEGSPFISVQNDLNPFFAKSKKIKPNRKLYKTEILINVDPDDATTLEKHQNVLASYVKSLSK
jgi:hypothetical protein